MKFIAYYDSPLGKITLAGDKAGLCGLWFEGDSKLLREFCIFADSGTGDLWLLSSGGEIAFYDHDLEFLSEANLEKFDLNLAGWLKIAELFCKFEAISDPSAAQKAEFKQSVAKICPQILEIWEI